MKRNPAAATWLALGAGMVTVALTGAAFWLSYEHLHDIAGSNGLAGSRAWAWPATVDLFIVTGEALMLRAMLRNRVDWWAIGLATVGSLGSIALNVAGVGTGAATMEYVVAAVPPSAALIAFGALMRQVHEAIAPVVTEAPIAEPEPLPEVTAETTTDAFPEPEALAPSEAVTPLAIETEWKPLTWPTQTSHTATAASAGTEPRQVVTVPVTITPAELRKQARKLNREVVAATGKPVTIERLRDEYSLSRRDAADLRRQIVEGPRP